MRCFNPAQGRPPIPPLGEDGRESYMAMAWNTAGESEGHVHLIRADLYAGQPCEPNGGLYVSRPNIGYTNGSAPNRGSRRGDRRRRPATAAVAIGLRATWRGFRAGCASWIVIDTSRQGGTKR